MKTLKILEVNFACDKCDSEKLLGFNKDDVKGAVLRLENLIRYYHKDDEDLKDLDLQLVRDTLGDFREK